LNHFSHQASLAKARKTELTDYRVAGLTDCDLDIRVSSWNRRPIERIGRIEMSTWLARGIATWGLIGLAFCSGSAGAEEIRVLASGAFTGAFQKIIPRFEQKSGHTVVFASGPSFGATAHAIPVRVAAGEASDVLIMVRSSLDALVAKGHYEAAYRTDLVQSRIGVGVKAGASKPDITTVDALRRTLLAAKTIGYSEGASGAFISTELLARLGVADQVAASLRKVTGELVGEAIARDEIELGLQQVSEMLSVPGVALVGPLPEEVQKASVMTAALNAKTRQAQAARAFIDFLATPEARADFTGSGLDPITPPSDKS
jgi:molybdate transport system substrate-binding protein